MATYSSNLKGLQTHLMNDEKLIASVYGMFEGNIAGSKISKNGVFAVTNKRALFFAKKLFGYDMEIFHFKNIASVEKSKSLLGHTLKINSSGNNTSMKYINKGNIDILTQTINDSIASANSSNQGQTPVQTDYVNQIKQLAELRDQGILSAEEFENKKEQLLSKI